MADATQHAQTIYDAIRATSGDRPFAFQSLEQLRHGVASWQAQNRALTTLRQASPDVQTAFLGQSVGWLKHESADHANFRVISTLVDAILHAINAAPKPLSTELILELLTQLRREHFTRHYFPFDQFLAVLTRDEITGDMRAELRRLLPHYAPSATGKIEQQTLDTRNRIAELAHVEGEKPLDRGRGPWSQIVFDEIAETDDITRFGWHALLEHCRTLEQTVPGASWKARARELIVALGESNAAEAFQRWLAVGPTPGQPPEAQCPIEDSAYQKGVVWCLALSHQAAAATCVGDFAIACLRKVPMLGAVSQKVGFACAQALGSMECNEAVSQLTRLRAKATYSVARRLIEKSLRQAAERNGLTVGDLEDLAVPLFALDAAGTSERAVDEQSASGINLFLGSDQVRFYRNRREISVDDVPAIVYSEVMRDVDLFTTVSAVGEDRTWSDQGERGTGVLAPRLDVDELTAIVALRVDLLSRVLPLTPIASRCTIEKSWLEVRGALGMYRIQLAWGTVGRVTDSGLLQPLNIPRKVLDDVSADFSAFPIDLDHRTEIILRKAYVLANDGQIDSADLIRQL